MDNALGAGADTGFGQKQDREMNETFLEVMQRKGWVQAQDGSWFKPKYHHFGVGVGKIVESGASASRQNSCSDSTTVPARTPKRIRQSSKPLLNQLETEFLVRLHDVYPSLKIRPQAKRYRLANGIWYKPDFTAVTVDGEMAWEVKGPHAFRGGFENLKVAASSYPEIRWILVWKENGQWQEQEVLP